MKLVAATRNRGKLVELRELLPGVEIVAADDLGAPDVVEDADTFAGNAAKKAREVSAGTGLPALADDSGLEVDALGGAPGVRSARYAGEDASDRENLAKLLRQLDGVPDERRGARFACVAVARFPDGREVAAFGSVEGRIVGEPRGREGFGYDPVFVPDEGDGRTFAEMGPADKNDLSHRARAMRAIKPRLLEYLRR